ncbi:MAG TPA: sugar phosphate isomerase/epimerase [Vicinamibacterales bacterium]|nr:sugar phosphate isomerase/epimerase [Vicinamibacterales bacterium]
MTRREWHQMTIGTLVATAAAPFAAQKKIDSVVAGVQLGAQSYSFRDRPLDGVIAGLAAAGLGSCELWQDHLERDATASVSGDAAKREALRKWRLAVPLETFEGVRRKFDAAGITLTAYNLSFRDDYTDEEIVRGFEMARALGVKVITASSTVSVAKRLDPVAQKFDIRVGFHNHSDMKPNEFATPDDFAAALKDASDYLAINLDIGHFTAANFDAVEFLDQHSHRIVSIHIKDRKRNQGPNVVFGTGDSPIVPVLRRLRDKEWRIPANIEYEYDGTDTVAEVRKCFEYCKQALEHAA